MCQKIVIIGTGFAGVWSALSAKRLINLHRKQQELEIVVVAPQPYLVMRPRLYEPKASEMRQSLSQLFESAGIKYVQGTVTAIDTNGHSITIDRERGGQSSIDYDRLILAAGSEVKWPEKIIGLRHHCFDVDSFESAMKLESHLLALQALPYSQARNTIVVCGAGFTGIELATELRGRAAALGAIRIMLLERSPELGLGLGPSPHPVIAQALQELGIEVRLGTEVMGVDAFGVRLDSGELIEANTVIWTAGVKANKLTEQILAPKDSFSRLCVDEKLRISSNTHIFATGDAAQALADTEGHFALMSCQHALVLGRVAGNNAAADLLDVPMITYSQPNYNCCLDLGSWGAVVTGGWEREVLLTGKTAKAVKTFINRKLIYPPNDADEALAAADPAVADSDALLKEMLSSIDQAV